MLDGLHVDKRGNDVLSTVVGLQQTDFRSRGLYLYARLGQHGSLHNNLGYTRARALGHNHHLHIQLYILDDEKIKVRCTDTRQGIRHCPLGEFE